MMKLINLMFMSFTLMIPLIISMNNNNKMIHPIILGMSLFFMTIITSINMSTTIKNHWFSFLTFLILIGGMMILFLYFISFNNNTKMMMKWKFIMSMSLKMIFLMIFIMTIYLNFNKMFWMFSIKNINIMEFNEKFNLTFMYLSKKNLPSMLCMIYLLLVLTLIVKLCINKKIKIRKINYEKIFI